MKGEDPFGVTSRMMDMIVVSCLPCDPELVPKGMEMMAAAIVSAEHRKIRCDRCYLECWIGLAQLKLARDPRASVICYMCQIKDAEIMAAIEDKGLTALDPDADNRPRRSSSWLVTDE